MVAGKGKCCLAVVWDISRMEKNITLSVLCGELCNRHCLNFIQQRRSFYLMAYIYKYILANNPVWVEHLVNLLCWFRQVRQTFSQTALSAQIPKREKIVTEAGSTESLF